MTWSGKQALIVGGSSGIGLESARLLLEGGASVTLIGRRPEKLESAREMLGQSERVNVIRTDLASDADVDQLVQRVRNDLKEIDFLVNAAGIFSPKPFLEHGPDDYDAYMAINRATFFVTQQVAKNMAEHGGGAMFFATCCVTKNVGPKLGPSSSAKACPCCTMPMPSSIPMPVCIPRPTWDMGPTIEAIWFIMW